MVGQVRSEPISFTRLRIPKGSELLARQIRDAILGGNLMEGDMLPSEKELMAQLGLSRATVREGLRLLEAEGLITTRSGRGGGSVVQRPGQGGHTRSLTTLLQFDGSTLNDLFEAWSALIPVCGRLAAEHIKPEQLDKLRHHLDKMAKTLDNARDFTALVVRFHMLIADATNNAVLRIYYNSLAELTYQQIQHVPFTSLEMRGAVAACRGILQAMNKSDGARAEYLLAQHMEAVGADIVRLAWPLEEQAVEAVDSPSRLTELAG